MKLLLKLRGWGEYAEKMVGELAAETQEEAWFAAVAGLRPNHNIHRRARSGDRPELSCGRSPTEPPT